jgi:branched-chain amino acid transport system substrate-binding protein
VANSPLFFLDAKYAQQAGIPVTGNAGDGTEWGQQPYTNMFPSDANNTQTTSPWTPLAGQLFKKYGGTVVGTYGYGISPSSTNATYATAKSAQAAGLKVGIMDVSIPFGSESFGTEALAAKSAGVNGYEANMDVNSDIALLAAMQQNGVHPKASFFATGYGTSLPSSNVWQTVQGGIFETGSRPWNIPTSAGVQAFQSAMRKYAHFTASDFPDYGQTEAYLGADLMIKGLEGAGANPTSASTIKSLRSITAYNAGGILAVTLDYSTNFGYNTKTVCTWLQTAGKTGFTPVSASPSCAQVVPGSTSTTPPQI